MSISIHPYLTFEGTCEEAFNFYRSVFGGEFTYIGKFSEMPPSEEYNVPDSEKDKIMHVSLPIGEHTTLMGSDTSEAFGAKLTVGDIVSISINLTSEAETERIYNELSAGGIIKMPLQKTFWQAYYGMFTDKFGINWMVNCELSEHKDFEKEHGA